MNRNDIDSWYRRVLTAVFGLAVVLPLAGFLPGETAHVSRMENRMLAPSPAVPRTPGSWQHFPRAFSAFFDDHFGFREWLVRSNQAVLLSLGAHSGLRAGVLAGKNGWLFSTADRSIEDYRGQIRLDQSQLQTWQAELSRRSAWLRERGIVYLFVIVPNKQSVYPEYLPEWLAEARGDTLADQLARALHEESGLLLLDLRQRLGLAKEGPELYFRMDTHWNAWGANHAQYAIMQTLAPGLGDIQPWRLGAEDIDWKEKRGGDMARILGVETRTELRPAFRYPKSGCPRVSRHRLGAQRGRGAMDRDECRKAGYDALIFHDSFMTQLRPFLSRYFRRSVYSWTTPDFCTLRAMVEEHHPAVVIEQRAERLLTAGPHPGCG